MGNLIRVRLTFSEEAVKAEKNAINVESFIDHESDSTKRQENLYNKLASKNNSISILSMEQLFHRHINGFGEIKQFVGDLSYLLMTDQLKQSPICFLNAFTFAFLASAKNFDLLMDIVNQQEVKTKVELLVNEINNLAEFERRGKPLAEAYSSLKTPYLSLRQIIARPSARDEQRILSLVLLSGLTTFAQLEASVDGNTSLVQRILALFKEINVIVEVQSKYCINENNLAIVLFCLRETQGLDPISMLENLVRDQ